MIAPRQGSGESTLKIDYGGQEQQILGKNLKTLFKDIPYVPNGGKSSGNGVEVLQMVVGMREGKDFYMAAVFLVPTMRHQILHQL